MINRQADSKPEGFYSEFNLNVKNILLMCGVVIVVMTLLINHFMYY